MAVLPSILRFAGVILLSTTLSPVQADSADTAPGHWLKRMVEARHAVSYEGDFVYLHDGRVSTMHIARQADSKGDRERLTSLDGPRREVVRDQGRVICVLPRNQELIADSPDPVGNWQDSLLQRLDDLVTYYDVLLGGRDRVAEREAQLLRIVPKDHLRYGYRLWIDTASGLLVKSELLGEQGRLLEQVVFIRLQTVDQVPVAHLEPSNRRMVEHPAARSELTPHTGEERWKADHLPAGFRLEEQKYQAISKEGPSVDHLVFSDGLATVSVFVEHSPSPHDGLEGLSRRGAINIFGVRHGEWLVTAMGEVPEETVKLIGESISGHD